jgi:serine/threonine-protein kinase
MVHRDVKPSNILLRQHDPHAMTHAHGYQAVLADFGIAKSLHANTQLTATGIVGTLDYLAPEQIVKPREVDHRVDIYALGVVAYQLLTGRLPFQTDNYGALLYAHLHEPPLDPRNLIAGLADEFVCAVLRALAKHPDERYATAGAFAQALMTTTPNINIKP